MSKAKIFSLLIIWLTLYKFIENSEYSNYNVQISVQTSSFYNGPVNMGINTVS